MPSAFPLCLLFVFETGSRSVELVGIGLYVDQADLNLIVIFLPSLSCDRITVVSHQAKFLFTFLNIIESSTDLLLMRSYLLISIMLYMKTDTFTVLIYQVLKDNESVMCCHITYFINYRYIFQKKVILLEKRCIVLRFP